MAEKDSTTVVCEGCGEIVRPGEKFCPMCKVARAQEAAKRELIQGSVYTVIGFLTNREGNAQGYITLRAEKGTQLITMAVSESLRKDAVVYLSIKEAQEFIDKLTYCFNYLKD